MSTDAVFSGDKDAPYYEDDHIDGEGDYALSKILGESVAENVLNVRCSILGKEIHTNNSLLNWFLSLPEGGNVEGYVNHIWNGVTTYQFADFCHDLINAGLFDKLVSQTNVVHLSPNKPINKYDLLTMFNKIFDKHIGITAVDAPKKICRILGSRYLTGNETRKSSDLCDEIVKMNDFFETNINKSKGE
jgi:dTDP-4-dehydrorhamnose reductase